MVKILKILTVSFCIIILLSNNAFALSEIFGEASNWISTGQANTDKTMDGEAITNTSNELFNILYVIATAAAFIVGAILGVKYMTAGIDKRVEVKESLYPYFISCVVAFGSLGIWKLATQLVKNF